MKTLILLFAITSALHAEETNLFKLDTSYFAYGSTIPNTAKSAGMQLSYDGSNWWGKNMTKQAAETNMVTRLDNLLTESDKMQARLMQQIDDAKISSFTNGMRFGFRMAVRTDSIDEALRVEFESRTNIQVLKDWIATHPQRASVIDIQTGIWITNSTALTTNQINALATSGEFCKVRGHVWQNLLNTFAVESSRARTCAICGKVETKTESDWK
jgi:hypothetical protein